MMESHLAACTACKKAHDETRYKLCAACRDWFRIWQQERRARLHSAGHCIRCGQSPTEGYLTCFTCIESAKQYYRERVDAAREAPGPNLLARGGRWVPITDPEMLREVVCATATS